MSDVVRNRVVDCEEHARIEGIHAGVGQVADRVVWFFGKIGHKTGVVDLDHATARRMLGTEHGQGCLGIASAVEVDQASQVEVRQVVGIERQEELLVLHPSSMVTKGTGTAQELWLECRADGRRAAPRLQVSQDDVGKVMEVDQHLVHLRTMQGVEPEVQ